MAYGRASDRGLRALGEEIEGRRSPAPPPNEGGLRALGDAVGRSRGGSGRGAGGGHGGGGGGPGLPPPGGGRRRQRWSTRRRVLTPIVALLVLVLVLAGVLYGYARYRYGQLSKVTVSAEHPVGTGQPFNMLVVGSDSRTGVSAATGVGTKTTVSGQRSDVIMVWHVDPGTKKITILSIPRDTLMQMEGPNVTAFGKFNRINAAYNSGPNLLVETIQDNLGITINHVVEVNFAGFKGAVDALGGVSMNFDYPAKDVWSGLDVTTTGCQVLDGTQALAVARSRHYQYLVNGQWQYTPTGDLGRIKRQDAFLKALVDAAKSKLSPFTLNAFIGSIPHGLVIDRTLSLNDLLRLAVDFHSVTPGSIATYTLPTTSIGYVTPWGDVLFVDQPADQQLLVSIFGTGLARPTTPPPDTTLQTPAPPSVAASGGASGQGSASTASAPAPSTTPTFDPTPCTPK